MPCTKITEHLDHFLDNKSLLESDHSLREPSQMMEASVNAWLKHWLSRQTKGWCPLILKDPSGDKTPTNRPQQCCNGKEHRIEYVEPNNNGDGDVEDDREDADATPDESKNPPPPSESTRSVPRSSGNQDGGL